MLRGGMYNTILESVSTSRIRKSKSLKISDSLIRQSKESDDFKHSEYIKKRCITLEKWIPKGLLMLDD